ncbi:MAG TPA: hypothetical protein VK206_03835 [Anaerolineales bacterium]|nr:hypothetical protein [Anaerolineales bacterium]
MGLYQYIREQEHRNDLVGELGSWMSKNYGKRPDHSSLAFELASQEFFACGNWTKEEAVKRLNENKKLLKIIKIEPRVSEIISEVLKLKNCQGYNRDEEYSYFKSKVKELVGYEAEKDEVGDSDSYNVVIQTIVELLPPDAVDLYPNGFPDEIYIDL